MKYSIERTTQFKKDFKLAEKQGLNMEELESVKEISPIFDKSYNNMSEEEIRETGMIIVRTAYNAAKEGVNIFEDVVHAVLPIEAPNEEYTTIAGQQGMIIDVEANIKAINDFLYGE